MTRRLAATLAAFAALTGAASQARADADPALGYVFASYGLPYHLTTGASRSGILSGEWTTTKPELAARPTATGASPWGLNAVGFGAGMGYDGFNVQLDVLSAYDLNAGALTFGYRLNLQLGNIEGWMRFAVGPQMSINYSDPGNSSRSGGILTMAEFGLDYFIVKETLALGVKGLAAPGYSWPLSFTADFDLKFGLRLII